jgi:DNA primase
MPVFRCRKNKGRSDLSPNLVEVLQQASRYYQRQLREHPQAGLVTEYLKRRGLSGEIAAAFGLGFAPDGWSNLLQALGKDAATQEALQQAGLLVKKDDNSYYDRFRGRVMFPIHDYRGRIIGFGGRIWQQGEPKYLNSPETPLFHKGRELYGLYQARDAIKREQRVLVVEGYMDVLALVQFGIDYAVATLGTATTREHLQRLFRFTPEIIFCFDGDRAGQEAAWRALENALPVLHSGRQIGFLFLPEGEDPDSLVRKEGGTAFSARLQQIIPLPDFFFQTLAKEVDLNRLDGRAKLAELARPLLSKLVPGVLQQMMLERLAELSRLEVRNLSQLLNLTQKRAVLKRSGAGDRGRPSLVRMALALLLQQPALAQQLPDPAVLASVQIPGMSLLKEVLQLLRVEPNLNTAAILERFRDSPHQSVLAKLAAWEHPALQQDTQIEFQGAIHRLRKVAYAQEAERLLNKDRLEGLNAVEKADLRRLLDEKRKLEVSP